MSGGLDVPTLLLGGLRQWTRLFATALHGPSTVLRGRAGVLRWQTELYLPARRRLQGQRLVWIRVHER